MNTLSSFSWGFGGDWRYLASLECVRPVFGFISTDRLRFSARASSPLVLSSFPVDLSSFVMGKASFWSWIGVSPRLTYEHDFSPWHMDMRVSLLCF
jgi:hypothetical protein